MNKCQTRYFGVKVFSLWLMCNLSRSRFLQLSGPYTSYPKWPSQRFKDWSSQLVVFIASQRFCVLCVPYRNVSVMIIGLFQVSDYTFIIFWNPRENPPLSNLSKKDVFQQMFCLNSPPMFHNLFSLFYNNSFNIKIFSQILTIFIKATTLVQSDAKNNSSLTDFL